MDAVGKVAGARGVHCKCDMKISRIALFLAAIAIEACVGDIPSASEGNDGGGGTGSTSGNGNGPGSDADGGSGGRDTGAGGQDAGGVTGGDGGFASDDGGLVIGCHDANDCPGTQVCCGRKADNDTSVYKSVSCEASCDGAYVYDHSTFCDPNDPHSCDGVVVNPHCEPSDILPGLYVCVSE